MSSTVSRTNTEPPLTSDEREALRWVEELAAAVHRAAPSPDGAVLIALLERPGARLATTELAAALAWEKSRLSHHLARMERRGLVVREPCREDLRVLFVVATAEGREAGAAAAAERTRAVRTLLAAVSAGGEVTATEPRDAGDDEREAGTCHGDDRAR